MSWEAEYYKVLFDPEDKVCWGRTKYDIQSRPIRYVDVDEQFVCINALKGTRRDANVVKYRNFLVEFDKIGLQEQLNAIDQIPYSTLVFSGGKSYHVVISLVEPLESEALYRRVIKTLYKKLEHFNPDTANGNPSRFSRAPEAIREDGSHQTVVTINSRIPNQEFFKWLGPLEPEYHAPEKKNIGSRMIPIPVASFLKYGVLENRNNAVFKNSIAILQAGYSFEECVDMCASCVDLPIKEIRAAVRSAQKKIK